MLAKMEQDSDPTNSDHSRAAAAESEAGSEVSLLGEQVRALAAEKDQLVADLEQAKLAVEASEREFAGQIAQARSAVETVERELVAATTQVQELMKEKDGLVADKERAQAQANVLRDKLNALDGESIFGFLKRRYFGQE
jgi:chromosome segregation ATPase